MRPDNKKPRSGQPQGKNGHLLGANNGRCSLPQYTHPSRNLKPFDTEAYCHSVDQIIIDAVLMLSGWPACIRYSYFVGSNGRLLVRAERKGAK
jgi:hypothetical protein